MAEAGNSATSTEGTVVFTDIVGFTEFTALQGDEAALALLTTQDRLVRSVLPPNARIVKELGDGLLIWFEDACEAVMTTLKLQQLYEQTSSESDVPLWVRAGVHSGRQTHRGDDLVGHDVNVASRVADVAGPSEVLVSDATLEKIGDRLTDVEFEELGPVVMKGLPEPMRLYRAIHFG